jgi:4-hydroxy-tetrahydrodipicolinate reductase
MGQRVIALAAKDERFRVVAALESARHPQLGRDAGALAGIGDIGVPLSVEGRETADAVIDFSEPDAAIAAIDRCLRDTTPIVVATTGLDDAQRQYVRDAGRRTPVVFSPSMSATVNLAMRLAEKAAEVLARMPGGADVEIIERHHRFKEDAPSGTALKFGELIATAMGLESAVHGRFGRVGLRPRQEIGYHAVRAGDNPGEHVIVFGLMGETLEIKVAASNRDCYAQGALLAALWVADRPPGLYDMADVLGLG